MEKTLSISFGALSPTIAKQLKSQGFKYKTEDAKHFEKLRESITYLMFADILNDKVKSKADKKLYGIIRRHVMKVNKLSAKK